MANHFKVKLAAALLLSLAACSHQDQTSQSAPDSDRPAFETRGEMLKTTDQFQARKGPAFDADAHPGKQLFSENCASCHMGGVPKAPQVTWLEMMAPDALLAAMNGGIMSQQAASLSQAERRQIAEYLVRQPLDAYQPPKPPLACTGASLTFTKTAPAAAAGWGYDTRRFVPASVAGFAAADISRLKLKWAFAYPAATRARSQPLIAMGAIFVGSQDGTVYALDLATGCARWTFRASAEVRTGIVMDVWRDKGGPATPPRLYFGDIIGRVYALDAETGRKLWMVRADDHPNTTITGTPALHGSTLYVPVSSLEVTAAADPNYPCCTFRGSVVALDAASGAVRWQTHVIPKPARSTATTKAGTKVYGPSGAPVWTSPTVDPARGIVYVGTGENYSSPADGNSDAIHAIDMKTGKHLWRFQGLDGDAWNVACMMENNPNCPTENGPDLDFSASPLLVRLANGKDLIVAGEKTGMTFGLDPDNLGQVRWKQKVGRGGTQGGIHFGMAAEGTRVYVPVVDMEDTRDGRHYDGPSMAGLHAIDATTGKILWRAPVSNVCRDREYCDPGISAAVTAVPGAVFAGHLDGWLRAYDGQTGSVLWNYDTTSAVKTVNGQEGHGGSMSGSGPAIANGHVVVNSGYGMYFHMPGNVLLVFSIDGK